MKTRVRLFLKPDRKRFKLWGVPPTQSKTMFVNERTSLKGGRPGASLDPVPLLVIVRVPVAKTWLTLRQGVLKVLSACKQTILCF